MAPSLIFGGVAVGVLVWAVAVFNGLVRLRNLCDNAWSDVDVHLKKRHDLIPNLVETVEGYAQHEKETLERVVQSRSRAADAASREVRIPAENALTSRLRQLFAVVEAYPDLKAHQSFLELQSDLSRVEDDIANARRYYNAVVRDYNTKQQVFPAILISGALGFRPGVFFEVGEAERSVQKVAL